MWCRSVRGSAGIGVEDFSRKWGRSVTDQLGVGEDCECLSRKWGIRVRRSAGSGSDV